MNISENQDINAKIYSTTKFKQSIQDANKAVRAWFDKIYNQSPNHNPMEDYDPNKPRYNHFLNNNYENINELMSMLDIIYNSNTIGYTSNIEYYLIELQTIYTKYLSYINMIFNAPTFIDNILHFSLIATLTNNNQLNKLQENIKQLQSGINNYSTNTNGINENIKKQLNRFCQLLQNLQDDLNQMLQDKIFISSLSRLNDTYDKFYKLITKNSVLTDNDMLKAIRRPFELFKD